MTDITLDKTFNLPDFRNTQVAFNSAIKKGIFTSDDKGEKWVGEWMYMHSDKSKKIDFFKNKWSRKFKEVSYE